MSAVLEWRLVLLLFLCQNVTRRCRLCLVQEKVRLRYKLTFNLGDTAHDESGDVDQFPPPNTWRSL